MRWAAKPRGYRGTHRGTATSPPLSRRTEGTLNRTLKLSLVTIIVAVAGFGLACDALQELSEPDPTETSPTPTAQPEPTIAPSQPPHLAMDLDSWIKIHDGAWEATSNGIVAHGAGFRETIQGIRSRQVFDFRGSETRIKWRADGGDGNYGAFWVF